MTNPRLLPQIDTVTFEEWIRSSSMQQEVVATFLRQELSQNFRFRNVSEGQLVGMMKKDAGNSVSQACRSGSYRLLQILTNHKEFITPITDSALRKIMQIQNDKIIVHLGECVRSIWKSCAFIVPEGHYLSEYDDKNHQALNYLLFLRTHPDLQILFRHYSASGLVNNLSPEFHISLDDILFVFGKDEHRNTGLVTIVGAKFEKWLVDFVREDVQQLRDKGMDPKKIFSELLKRYHPDTRQLQNEKDIVLQYVQVVNAMKKAGEFSK